MVFAKRLRERREAKKLTQQELGEKVGVKKATICGWEAGRSIPNLDVVNKLADALGTTGQYLVGYSDEAEASQEVIDYDFSYLELFKDTPEGLPKDVKWAEVLLMAKEDEVRKLFRNADPVYQQVVLDILRAHQKG